MLSSLFSGDTSTLEWRSLLICIAASLLLGLLVAAIHMIRNVYTKNFVITLAVLPILVQSVIMLVNGNLGTGVAILGAFSLIRFRSVPGGSREITSVFWSMGIGLATGMGYVGYVVIFSIIVALFLTLLYTVPFGDRQATSERELKVTIPEDLDYPQLFDDLFEKYTHSAKLTSVRTTTMGSLYELRYQLLLKDQAQEKQIIDEVRVRNGNLPVVLGKLTANRDEL
ncbi:MULTISPECIES: DUF4956 domain-containing protein [Enterococcus]|uniref:DUF4956 domain-containing protein n=1 Tax=Enterococcus innesii TaxID=2839759 RepID=A0ABM7XRQ3_9ENTE|nr:MULTISPECIES: DUF4956 domain-containing protein [Enterococcus]MBZ0323779.1 DUF4956 domain-containing protein [Enterococcus casseliflavus]QQU19675.1 DUF4956 domain-containing protein [Enterococcus casseliflavus]TPR58540.1 DUF4956 domain-containing protein [Enterococcus sp. OL5]BDG67746.1 DUF4956 domain-containing protein [Enterococcus innesii]